MIFILACLARRFVLFAIWELDRTDSFALVVFIFIIFTIAVVVLFRASRDYVAWSDIKSLTKGLGVESGSVASSCVRYG